MRDWFSGEALYVPLWVLLGALMGLWHVGLLANAVWFIIGLFIACLAWRSSVRRAREAREITENLGKLVSVTEPSPSNILASAAAKILTLDHEITTLKAELTERNSREWSRLTNQAQSQLADRLRTIGPYTAWIIYADQWDCMALARDFYQAFRVASWNVPNEPYSQEEVKEGIRIRGSLSVVEQEAVRKAIVESTTLPVTVYETSDEQRRRWDEALIVLSVGFKWAVDSAKG